MKVLKVETTQQDSEPFKVSYQGTFISPFKVGDVITTGYSTTYGTNSRFLIVDIFVDYQDLKTVLKYELQNLKAGNCFQAEANAYTNWKAEQDPFSIEEEERYSVSVDSRSFVVDL